MAAFITAPIHVIKLPAILCTVNEHICEQPAALEFLAKFMGRRTDIPEPAEWRQDIL